MSRWEEQRGWRNLYLWGLGIGALLAVVVAGFAYFAQSHKAGMESTASPALIDGLGLGAVGPAVLHTQQSDIYGEYLVDAAGHPLYLFKKDEHQESLPRQIECKEACAKAWPPLMTSSAPSAVSPAKDALLAVVERPEGSRQVTYNGWPLYRYAKDVGPERVTGEGVKDFGGKWYLVSPSGREIEKEAPSSPG
jgi:predicted lipoprotein with Yx(FWY)xxD motif